MNVSTLRFSEKAAAAKIAKKKKAEEQVLLAAVWWHVLWGCTPRGSCDNMPLLRRVLRRVLKTASEKVLRRVLRRCLPVGFRGKKGSQKGSQKASFEKAVRRRRHAFSRVRLSSRAPFCADVHDPRGSQNSLKLLNARELG